MQSGCVDLTSLLQSMQLMKMVLQVLLFKIIRSAESCNNASSILPSKELLRNETNKQRRNQPNHPEMNRVIVNLILGPISRYILCSGWP